MNQTRNRNGLMVCASLTLAPLLSAQVTSAQQPPAAPQETKAQGTEAQTALIPAMTLPGGYEPLSAWVQRMGEAGGLSLSLAPALPDPPVFAAAFGTPAETLLKQTGLLLTDDQWQYDWAGQTGNTYQLRRVPVDQKMRQAARVQKAKDRLRQWQFAMMTGPSSWDEIAQTDPALASELRQPMNRASIGLLGTLSPDQLDSIFAGQPMIVPFATLTPQQQAFASQVGGADHVSGYIVRDAQGHVTASGITGGDLSHGRVEVRAVPAYSDPSALSLSVFVCNQMTDGELSGGDALYPMGGSYFPPQIAAVQGRQVASIQPLTGKKTVTIWATTPTRKDAQTGKAEPYLAAYLRSLAEQAHLTLLAYWPPDAKYLDRKLAQSVVQAPVADALNTLAGAYRCRWTVEDKVVRFRYDSRLLPTITQLTPEDMGLPPRPAVPEQQP